MAKINRTYFQSMHIPADDETAKWTSGVFLPILLVSGGLWCVVKRTVTITSKYRSRTHFEGVDAIILGIMLFSFAAILHFHYYWRIDPHPSAQRFYNVGKVNSILFLILSGGWVLWVFIRQIFVY